MIIYKTDVIKKMAEKGYTAKRIRQEKILAESTMQKIRSGGNITLDTLNTICIILRCQPADIIEVVATHEEKIKFS